MFREIFGFELRQQLKGPLFWIFLVLFAAGGIALTSSPAITAGGAVGNVYLNAPIVIVRLTLGFALLATLFVVVFMARAMLRDFNNRTAETLFSTPVTRGAYLGGRFAAGFLIALAIASAAMFGMFVGTLMPWIDAARLGPVTLAPWLWNFGVIVVPDMLFIAALLFLLAATTRSLLVMFVGVIAMIALQAIAGNLLRGLDHHLIASLVDPYGAKAVVNAVRYWTPHELNTQLPAVTGALLANRLLWIGVAIVLIVAGFALFRPDRDGLRLRLWPRRRTRRAVAGGVPVSLSLPRVATRHGARSLWQQFVAITWMDLRSVVRGALFPIMLLLGVGLIVSVLLTHGKIYGTAVYPVTHLMVADIKTGVVLFLLIVLFFLAGELVWRNRKHEVADMVDSMPVPGWISLTAKAATLTIITLIFMLIGALTTIGYQLSQGYTHLEPGLYAGSLALAACPFVLIGILALVLQVLANKKFLGYLLFVIYLVSLFAIDFFDLNDKLYQFPDTPGMLYSDLNGFGHFLGPALWFTLYWALFAALLMVLATLFWNRGRDRRRRWRNAASRLGRRPLQITLAALLVTFLATGSWIFYNTHILHSIASTDASRQARADYEKLYSKYANAPQPRITAVDSQVDIYPYQRKLHMHVTYTLTNKHAKPINTLYMDWDTDIAPTHLTFGPHTVVKRDTRLGFTIYKLGQPLAPGASRSFSFDVDFAPHGFKNNAGPMDTRLVYNGTFLINNATLFPSFGYNRAFQLTDKNNRRHYGLNPDVPRTPPLSEDPAKRANTYISSDSDWIDFNTVVSTAADQTAIAPGALVKSWTTGDRRYFHYQTHAPILNFYAYLSGKWKVRSANFGDVRISVYYNPAHDWNVDDLIRAARDSLRYYTTHFGPYQFKYLRIIEIPNYWPLAQSFAGTVAFSESVGFIAKLGGKCAINYPYYIAAHEIAHQWWAHQVIGANMQGATMLSESLAQYSALMVMKHHYGANKMRRFLQYELDRYLAARKTDRNGETPLGKVEGQTYIRYQKASMIFYALQDYIGASAINRALRTFLDAYRFEGPPYPTSLDLVKDIKAAAGPKWDELIDDSFWKITLYDNRVVSAKAKKLSGGSWQVTMKVHAAKYYANAKGKQTRAKMTLPVDIGVFAKAPDGIEGDEPVLYLEKRKVADGDSTITLTVKSKPYEVGIDPYNELVDRKSADNRARVVIQ